MKKATLTPIALALILSGCAVGPDYEKPETTMADTYLYSDAVAEQETTEQAEYWWTQFEDATLNTMVADMQKQSIPLKMAAERIKMADSYKNAVESFKVPTVSLGAGYYNYQISENDPLVGPALAPLGDSISSLNGSPLGNVSLIDDNQYDGGFIGATIAWEVDIFNRIDRQANAAGIRKEQAEIYRNGLNTLLTADLIHNYLQYRGAQERIALTQSNIEDQQRSVELVGKVVENGYGSQLDLAQAKAVLAATKAILPQLEIAKQVHKQRMAVLLGESLMQVDIRLADKEPLPEIKGVIPVGLPSDLLKRRPDIQMAEREMAALNEEVAASIANRYPKFYLTGTPGVAAGDFDDLFDSDSFSWVGSAGISWNIFDGGRSKAMVEINQARFDAAALGYKQTVDSAFTEVDSMLFTYGRSQENQTQVNEALIATNKAVDKAKTLYRAGLIDYLSVLDAQRQQRTMQDYQLSAKLQTAQVTVAVYKSLGGDWTVTDETEIGTDTLAEAKAETETGTGTH